MKIKLEQKIKFKMGTIQNVSLKKVLRLSIKERIIFSTEIIFLFAIFHIYFIVSYLKIIKIGNSFIRRTKLRKRFIKGSILGYTISKFILKNEHNNRHFHNIINGIKYGHWGITIIALDFIQDSLFTDSLTAKEFSIQCANIISQKSNSFTDKSLINERAEIIDALNISEILLKTQSTISIKSEDSSREIFVNRAIQLLNGQLYSMEQRQFSENKNLNWYFTDVLNQKTLNFFLAPISLFCNSNKCIENYNKLESTFLTLNECYSHWQLVDDIADLTKDIQDNIITTPGFVLITQGQLAEKIKKLDITDYCDPNSLSEIEKLLKESKLIPSYFPLSCNRNSDDIFDELVIALSNTNEDFNKDLNELISDKITSKELFLKSYLSNDFKEVLFQIKKSKTCERILSSVFSPHKIQSLDLQLKNEDTGLKLSMYALNLIIESTYLKALKEVSIK